MSASIADFALSMQWCRHKPWSLIAFNDARGCFAAIRRNNRENNRKDKSRFDYSGAYLVRVAGIGNMHDDDRSVCTNGDQVKRRPDTAAVKKFGDEFRHMNL